MTAIDDRIATLEAKLKQEKAKKQRLEAARKAAASKKLRAEETRRKILVGAAILAKVERGDWPKERLMEMLSSTLTRDDDRKLFDLAPLTTPSSTPKLTPTATQESGSGAV